ncbi:polynucleotide kinase-phosphatase [Frankia sp. AiPa1]|uniref:polynucleotide kinase-phosphatase n=1 Tax=Frankia sp. AiPa1 TaxID=573492 RepID=UPI00202AD590|nr:polynucleotide kinase-phosphatase [Frankia sp. AiPa1]MCL9762807.1 polynucleotide kinase-phosphatase [Frankia sp. AiPa1]
MTDPTSASDVGPRVLAIPEMCLVVLVGVSGSGKSTFARTHFAPTQVLSSDFCRGLVADDENDQGATPDAFDVLHYIAGKRLAAGRLTVVDATNVQAKARASLVALAREHDVLPVAIVLDVPEKVCVARNAERPDRPFGPGVIRRQAGDLRRGLRGLAREGFRRVHVLRSVDEVAAASVEYTKLFTDLRHETGPFDIIGDVHGCRDELELLLTRLGYDLSRDEAGRPTSARHPAGRRAVFVGDLVDRGPDVPGVLRLAMGMVAEGSGHVVCGNHENKLVRALQGKKVTVSHGLAASLEQLGAEPAAFQAQVTTFCQDLVSHYVFDAGRLVVAHAGLKEAYHGRASARVRSFALYGDTTGETDEYGLPVRHPWAREYRGRATVVYGHTPSPEPEWVNNTLCVDTGCVFGGSLSALRYPERELVAVPAARVYVEPARPLAEPQPADGLVAPEPAPPAGPAPSAPSAEPAGQSADPSSAEALLAAFPPLGPAAPEPGPSLGSQLPLGSQLAPGSELSLGSQPSLARDGQVRARRPGPAGADLLDISDVLGRRFIETRHGGRIQVREENALAALEVMSRFALDPRWLVYLPPTMSPPPTTTLPGLLEHPGEAFAAYRADGVDELVCEEKHMGSRAVVVLCRNADVAAARFGATDGSTGVVHTRTGRPFFPAPAPSTAQPSAAQPLAGQPPAGEPFAGRSLAERMLARLRAAVEDAGLWDELAADWLVLDAEIMPWSAKAGELITRQYAAAGAAARTALPAALDALTAAAGRGIDVADLLGRTQARRDNAEAFTAAYRHYCWPTDGLTGVRIAPFMLLATGRAAGTTYVDRDHRWHLAIADRLAAADPDLVAPTRHILVRAGDPDSIAAGVRWWEDLTAAGGEGMVVKPAAGLARGERGLVQPGVKVRGREYLRIVYGPDYTQPEHLDRLRSRGLGRKRSLAFREYALGLEALERAVAGEPLWRVHECVFAILALESEPVDPRL